MLSRGTVIASGAEQNEFGIGKIPRKRWVRSFVVFWADVRKVATHKARNGRVGVDHAEHAPFAKKMTADRASALAKRLDGSAIYDLATGEESAQNASRLENERVGVSTLDTYQRVTAEICMVNQEATLRLR